MIIFYYNFTESANGSTGFNTKENLQEELKLLGYVFHEEFNGGGRHTRRSRRRKSRRGGRRGRRKSNKRKR